MAKLSARDRARLPDSAFAYVDSRGRRRLPIHDEAHLRNALARFGRVVFESDAARERARRRLLNAAKKYGIVPVGFITGQLEAEQKNASARVEARSTDAATLPTGFVTFLLTDIEDSTALLRHLQDGYADVLNAVRETVRDNVVRAGGREVDARADEFFAVFAHAIAAVECAIAIQRALARRSWPDALAVKVRAGVHSGRPTLTETGYIGLAVHTAARVCSAAHGGQIVVSGASRDAIVELLPADVRLRALGRHRLAGLAQPEPVFQVEATGLRADFPPLRNGGETSTQFDD